MARNRNNNKNNNSEQPENRQPKDVSLEIIEKS